MACVGPLQVMRAETLNVSTVADGTSSGPVKSVRGIALSFALLKPLLAAAVRLSWPVPIGFVSPFLYTSARTSKKVPTSSLFLRPTHTLAASRPRRAFAAPSVSRAGCVQGIRAARDDEPRLAVEGPRRHRAAREA